MSAQEVDVRGQLSGVSTSLLPPWFMVEQQLCCSCLAAHSRLAGQQASATFPISVSHLATGVPGLQMCTITAGF